MLTIVARVYLALVIGGIVASSMFHMPFIDYLAGGFPTFAHDMESSALLSLLVLSLLGIASRWQPAIGLGVVTTCSLFFFSAAGLVLRAFRATAMPDQPPPAWLLANSAVVASLGVVVIAAGKSGALGWKRFFFSLLLAWAACLRLLVLAGV